MSTVSPKSTANYDTWASDYDTDTHSYGWCAPEKTADALTNFLEISQHSSILDIGAGTGAASSVARQKGATVVGTDISAEMLDLAAKCVPPFSKLINHNIDTPLPMTHQGKYDGILSAGVLHFSSSLSNTIKMLYAGLKKGGVMSVTYIPNQSRPFGTQTRTHDTKLVSSWIKTMGATELKHEEFTAYFDKGNQEDPVQYQLLVLKKG